MNPDALTIYESWDLTLPALPPRSRLYCLEPVGVGTVYIESLTGYIARLAEAHGVHTRTLVVRELVPLLGRKHLSRLADNSLTAFWSKDTRALNGTQTLARDWVLTLERLTLRHDLRFLTLLTWANVLPPGGLLRPTRVWCPACYQEWHTTGQVVYEPLLWALAVVIACPYHGRRLRSQCSYLDCRHTLSLLAARSRPGHCSRCERWLGDAAEPMADEILSDNELQRQTWVVEAVGELLVAALTLPTAPQRERIAAAISACITHLTGGNMTALARTLPVSPVTLNTWQRGKQLPQIDSLLLLCDRLGILPLRFLTEGSGVSMLVRMPAPLLPHQPQQPKVPRRPFDTDGVRRALEAVLAADETPPPAMRQVARRLGYPHSGLHHRFPDLCRNISARYLAYRKDRSQQRKQRLFDEIRQAVTQVGEQGLYPSANRVAQCLSLPGFIRHPEARAVWHETLQQQGWTLQPRR